MDKTKRKRRINMVAVSLAAAMLLAAGETGVFAAEKKETAYAEEEKYRQHKVSTTFSHSHNVAVCAHYLALRWKKKVSMKELATGAMLHDYYLYDIRESGLTDYQHGIRHPLTALENAEKIFELSEKEKNIIVSHMWPLAFSRKPACTEAWLVSIADKYCAYQEMYRGVVHIEDVLGKVEAERTPLAGEKK